MNDPRWPRLAAAGLGLIWFLQRRLLDEGKLDPETIYVDGR